MSLQVDGPITGRGLLNGGWGAHSSFINSFALLLPEPKEIVTFESVDHEIKLLECEKATEQHFPLVLFIVL